MSTKLNKCYFLGYAENGDPVVMYDAYMDSVVNNLPSLEFNSNYKGLGPRGSIFFKTTEDPLVFDNSTDPLYLANGNNMFYVNSNKSLRPIIDRSPRVFIGTTLPEYLPTGSLFIKTTEDPASLHDTDILHYEGMYYIVSPNTTIKLAPNA